MKESHTPGDSDLFYELEAVAAIRKNVELVFLKEQGRSVINGRIEEVFVRDGAEMVRMESGLEIPLSTILQIDSKIVVGFT